MPGKGKPGGYNIKPINKLSDPNYQTYREKVLSAREESNQLQTKANYWKKEGSVQAIYGSSIPSK